MESTIPWHDSDEFWETTGSFIFSPQIWASATEEVSGIIKLLDLKPPADVLDLCCGPGRHVLELDRRGFVVTGVDRTEAYLKEARERAEKESLAAEFIVGDMRRFCRANAFDAVINMLTAFGYFEDPEEDRQVLKNVYDSLRPGGKFLIEFLGREVLARIFQPRDWDIRGGAIILEERIPSDDWSFVDSHWIIISGLARKEFKIRVRSYAASELTAMLRQIGFQKIKTYGGLDGSPYDHQARRLVVVAQK